jgi:hypothetical protein
MASDKPDTQVLLERLEKLERQNRRLKRVGVLALVGVGAALLMGYSKIAQFSDSLGHPVGRIIAPSTIVAGTIQTRDLELRDPSEHCLARLYTFKGEPKLELMDANGNVRAGLGVFNETAYLDVLGIDPKSSIDLTVGRDGPSLSVSDQKGFSSVIGVADLENVHTGESYKTSAASLVIFGKNGKTIWRAPSM